MLNQLSNFLLKFVPENLRVRIVNLRSEVKNRRRWMPPCIIYQNHLLSTNQLKSLVTQGRDPSECTWGSKSVPNYITWPRVNCDRNLKALKLIFCFLLDKGNILFNFAFSSRMYFGIKSNCDFSSLSLLGTNLHYISSIFIFDFIAFLALSVLLFYFVSNSICLLTTPKYMIYYYAGLQCNAFRYSRVNDHPLRT